MALSVLKFMLAVLLCCAALTLTESLAAQSTPSPVPSPTPSTTEEWTAWRNSQIKIILQPTLDFKGEKLISREEVILKAAAAYNFIEPRVEQDPSLVNKDNPTGNALANFYKFVKAIHWMALKDGSGHDTHALGYEITDRDFWSYARDAVIFPPLLRSQDFLTKISHPSTYRDAVNMIEANNQALPKPQKWIVLPFKAQFILSVDHTTYGRLLILVPNQIAANGDKLDQWILFSIATPEMDPDIEIHNVSMIAVRRDTHSGPGITYITYPVDFSRQKDPQSGQINIVPTMLLAENTSKNCYECHKTGVVPIHPDVEYTFDEGGKLVPKEVDIGSIPNRVNALIEYYGPPNFGFMDTEGYGPGMGPYGQPAGLAMGPEMSPVSRRRAEDLIPRATQGLNIAPQSYNAIRYAMNCAECHNSAKQGPLNYLLAVRSDRDVRAFEGSKGMIETYIAKGWMPPDNHLSADERKALWKCLMEEYFDLNQQSGLLIDWLKGQ